MKLSTPSLTLLLALATSACGVYTDGDSRTAEASSDATSMAAAATETPTDNASAPAKAVEVTDFDSALAAAKKDGKIVVVDFYTTWCGPCKKLDRETWPDEKVAGWLADNAIFIKIDAEKEASLASRFRVSAYPTIVFLDAEGEVLRTVIGFQSPRGFLKAAKAATKT